MKTEDKCEMNYVGVEHSNINICIRDGALCHPTGEC